MFNILLNFLIFAESDENRRLSTSLWRQENNTNTRTSITGRTHCYDVALALNFYAESVKIRNLFLTNKYRIKKETG